MIELKPFKKILLVEPPFFKIFGYKRWYYPVTLTIIGTYLEGLGHKVRVFDADMPDATTRALSRQEVRAKYHLYESAIKSQDHPTWDRIMEVVADYKPDAVGLTSISAQIASADIIAAKIKKKFGSKVKTILGGSHVDGMLDTFAKYDFGLQYDLVVRKDLRSLKDIFSRRPKKDLIFDKAGYDPQHISSILTSLGCPNKCSFCHHSVDRTFAYRDMKNLKDEVEESKALFPGLSLINLIDENLFSKTAYFRKVARLLKDYELKFTLGARVVDLSRERIDEFMDFGGQKMHIGIESGSQKILDRTGKNLRVNQIIRRAKLLNDSGLYWQAFFIVGFPFEGLDDIKRTEELIFRIRPSFVSLNRFTPYPGTEIYKQYYRDAPVKFSDLFQLNSRSLVKLPAKTEDYINGLFRVFDDYNARAAIRCH